MGRLEGLDEDRFHRRHLVRPENVVIAQIRFPGTASLIIPHFFTNCITQGLGHTAFDLPGGSQRVDNHPRIHRHHQLIHRHLSGFDIHRHLGKLGGKRRRRRGRNIGSHSHDLFLVGVVQRAAANFCQGDRPAIRSNGAAGPPAGSHRAAPGRPRSWSMRAARRRIRSATCWAALTTAVPEI